ncbi:MAG: glycosyltransferase family 2 protein [Tannerellaceae bacterium]|jgi:GT2 family glycosyltransferase|nr:glycosyltransferase family 2 protein [Tannerellaceae bacterium]
MKLYVIIVTYNGRKWYDKCFGSVRNSSVPAQAIVIDNASSDDTVSYIKENYPEIHLVESNKNLGFGKANNIGIKYALEHGADYVYLLNQDAWVYPKTFETLIKVSVKNPDYGIISPMQITANEDKFDKKFSTCCSTPSCENLIDDLYFNTVQEVYEIRNVMAAHWLITKASLLFIGGFSPVFFHYGEDYNLIDRMRYHGFKCGICPLTTGVHDRELRKTTKRKSMYMYYIDTLIRSSNINMSGRARMKSIFISIIYFMIAVYRYRSISPIIYFFKWLCLTPKIIKYNCKTKRKRIFFDTFES